MSSSQLRSRLQKAMFFILLETVVILALLYMPLVSYLQTSFMYQNQAGAQTEQLRRTLHQNAELVKVPGVNCSALFNGSGLDTARMTTTTNRTDTPISDSMYINLTADCTQFQLSRGYLMSSLTQEEEDFPLAYSMLVYRDAEMMERLLRAIYRPQNFYCVHVDLKSTEAFYAAIFAISNCFPNVWMAKKRIAVVWGTFSVLEPELVCMEELWRYPRWKYFINLTGQEFPLKTNFQLVKIFKAYAGAIDVQTLKSCAEKDRWNNTRPPHGLRPVKGSVHIAVNRAFVDFVLHDQLAADLLGWTRTTVVPDETFFAILNANPQLGIRGSYTGWLDSCQNRTFVARYKMWKGSPCSGKLVRDICILSVGDLSRLGRSKRMFANKFFLNWDRLAVGCLEELVFNLTRDQFLGLQTFDATYYEELDFVQNQVT